MGDGDVAVMRPDWMKLLAGTDTPFTGSGDDDAGDFEPPYDPFYEAYSAAFDAELRRRCLRNKPALDAYPEAVRAWREGGEVGPKPRLMWSFDRGAFIDDGEESSVGTITARYEGTIEANEEEDMAPLFNRRMADVVANGLGFVVSVRYTDVSWMTPRTASYVIEVETEVH